MRKYLVTMPITGIVSLEVEADDKKSAIEAFWNRDDFPDIPDEWECTEHIVQGNFFRGMINDVVVELIEDDEEGM